MAPTRNGLLGGLYTDPSQQGADPAIAMNASPDGAYAPMIDAGLGSSPQSQGQPQGQVGAAADSGSQMLVGPGGRSTPFYIPPTAYPIDWSAIANVSKQFQPILQAMPQASLLGTEAAPVYGSDFGGDNIAALAGGTNGLTNGAQQNGIYGAPAGARAQGLDQSPVSSTPVSNNGVMFYGTAGYTDQPWTPDAMDDYCRIVEAQGAKCQRKGGEGGKPSGRIYLADGTCVEVNVNGRFGFKNIGRCQDGGSASTAGAGGPGGAGGSGLGPAFSLDPRMSGAIDSAILNMLQNGTGPFGDKTWEWLMHVLDTGGLYNDPMVKQQLVKARDAEARAMGSQVGDARSFLADRGLLSLPGTAQGAEVDAVERITNDLGVTYASNVSQIEIAAMDRANQNMMAALSLATGLSEDQAHNMLSAIGLGTQRQVALADLALRQLEQDTNWQMFLANYGLSVDTLRFQIQNGQFQQVLALIMAFMQNIQVGANGA